MLRNLKILNFELKPPSLKNLKAMDKIQLDTLHSKFKFQNESIELTLEVNSLNPDAPIQNSKFKMKASSSRQK